MHLNCDCENKLAYNVKYTRARLFKNITLLSYQINAQRYMKLKKSTELTPSCTSVFLHKLLETLNLFRPASVELRAGLILSERT